LIQKLIKDISCWQNVFGAKKNATMSNIL